MENPKISLHNKTFIIIADAKKYAGISMSDKAFMVFARRYYDITYKNAPCGWYFYCKKEH